MSIFIRLQLSKHTCTYVCVCKRVWSQYTYHSILRYKKWRGCSSPHIACGIPFFCCQLTNYVWVKSLGQVHSAKLHEPIHAACVYFLHSKLRTIKRCLPLLASWTNPQFATFTSHSDVAPPNSLSLGQLMVRISVRHISSIATIISTNSSLSSITNELTVTPQY